MKAEDFLEADRRWEIWKCYSHQQYLDRFFIPGKFHSDVPDALKTAYLTVERLISYSYFYYPLTEEVHSKMTRIFEMAVRLRAEQLGIVFKQKYPSLNSHIECFRRREGFDDALIKALLGAKNLRNLFAHPKGLQYSGPIGYINIIYLVNLINRLFVSTTTYNDLIEKINPLKELTGRWVSSVLIFETGMNRYLVHNIFPLLMSRDKEKTLWMLDPILKTFPQSMEDFNFAEPFFVKLKNLKVNADSIDGFNLLTDSLIRIAPSTKVEDSRAAAHFKAEYESSDESVRRSHTSYNYTTACAYLDRFIYDEFWCS